MRLKYQMRGLGIGMVVTAIIIGVTTGHAIPLTDAEIRARALELGMVEGNSLKLSDVAGMSTPVPEGDRASESDTEKTQEPENGGADGQRESQSEDAGRETSDGSRTEEPDAGNQGESHSGETDTEEQAQSRQEGTDDGNGEFSPGESDAESDGQDMVRFVLNGDMVTVTIELGADSYTISKALAQAGLVEDAGEYDDYLCDNLYSRKIVSGNYEIPLGASGEEIAKIITLGR